MEKQSVKNHVRYYPPHHFVYYPIVSVLLATSIWFAVTSNESIIWIFISVIFIILFALAFMLRQHYALTLQNRIVRLELRYRYFTLTGERLELLEERLSDGQMIALRFASDAELPAMVQSALSEILSPNAIKKNIMDWRGDYERV